ncbi:MAG: hypothetical protein K0V04_42490 [Deltaproteobacteria bacterium]|nr:hypothetical protein [Deltaproteobacteria bacterium]
MALCACDMEADAITGLDDQSGPRPGTALWTDGPTASEAPAAGESDGIALPCALPQTDHPCVDAMEVADEIDCVELGTDCFAAVSVLMDTESRPVVAQAVCQATPGADCTDEVDHCESFQRSTWACWIDTATTALECRDAVMPGAAGLDPGVVRETCHRVMQTFG